MCVCVCVCGQWGMVVLTWHSRPDPCRWLQTHGEDSAMPTVVSPESLYVLMAGFPSNRLQMLDTSQITLSHIHNNIWFKSDIIFEIQVIKFDYKCCVNYTICDSCLLLKILPITEDYYFQHHNNKFIKQ